MPYFGVLWANIGVFFAPIHFFIKPKNNSKRFFGYTYRIGEYCFTS